jgi:hypothetical protein
MTNWQIVGMAILNFNSVLLAVALIQYKEKLRRQKMIKEVIGEIEEQIDTEMKFIKIAQDFDKDEN